MTRATTSPCDRAMRRREFLGSAAGLAACGLLELSTGGCALVGRDGGHASLKLSLSCRIAETFGSKEESSMTFGEIVEAARSIGYEAICLRASQGGIHTPLERLTAMREQADGAGLAVSMVTGDFAVPRNDERGPDCLRDITPYLDLAGLFRADLIRVCMKRDDDIPWARRAADEAAERGIRLAHQAHCASLFETVDGSVRVLREIDRANFGIVYEPANWMIAGEDYLGGIATVRPWLFNVYVQNHRLDPAGEAAVTTWKRGPVRLAHIGLDEPGGVDFPAVFAALRDAGYRGHVTVHQASAGDATVSPVESARRSYEYLRPLVAGRS